MSFYNATIYRTQVARIVGACRGQVIGQVILATSAISFGVAFDGTPRYDRAFRAQFPDVVIIPDETMRALRALAELRRALLIAA